MAGDRPATRSVDIADQITVRGPVYNQTMCLIQEGRLCVSELPFVSAPIPYGDTAYRGVLGLAKGRPGQTNYVKQLKADGVIDKAIVSLNFEYTNVRNLVSQVAFGEIIYTEIEGGEQGIRYYSNLGRHQWGLQIDDFLYNGKDMTNG